MSSGGTAEGASDALLAVPSLDSSDDETSLLSDEADAEEAKVTTTDDHSWPTVASFLAPDVQLSPMVLCCQVV